LGVEKLCDWIDLGERFDTAECFFWSLGADSMLLAGSGSISGLMFCAVADK